MSCDLKVIVTQVIAQLCGHVGFEQITESSLELLLDVFEQYFVALAKNICSLGTFDGNAEIEDGLFAIRMLGQTPQDLLKFINETGPYFSKPPPTVCGPMNGKVCLNIPPADHEELKKRPAYIPAHLPLNYCWENNDDETIFRPSTCNGITSTTTTATTTTATSSGVSATLSSGTTASRSLPAWACRTSYRMTCVSVDPLTKCLVERCPPGRIVDNYPDSPTYGTSSVASGVSSAATIATNTNASTNVFSMQPKREPLHSPASLRSGASSPQVTASTSLQGATDAQWAAALQATPAPQPLKRIVYTPSRFDPSDTPSSSHLKRSVSGTGRTPLFGKHTVPSRATESATKRQVPNAHHIPPTKTTRLNVVARTRRRSRVGRPRGSRFGRNGRTPKSIEQLQQEQEQVQDLATSSQNSSSDLLDRTPPAVDDSLNYTMMRSDDDNHDRDDHNEDSNDHNEDDQANKISLEFTKEQENRTLLRRDEFSGSDRSPAESLSSISNFSKGPNENDDDDDDKSIPARHSPTNLSNKPQWTSKPSSPCPNPPLSPSTTKLPSPEVDSRHSLSSPIRTPPALESTQPDVVHESKSEPSNMVTVTEPISTILQSGIRPKLKPFGRGRPRGRKRSTSTRLSGINSLFQNPLRLKGSQIVPPTSSDSTNQSSKPLGQPITNVVSSESSTKSVIPPATARTPTSQRIPPFGKRQRRYSNSSFTRRRYSNSDRSAHKTTPNTSKSNQHSRNHTATPEPQDVLSSPSSDSTEPMIDEARAELLVIPIKTETLSIFVETCQSDNWKTNPQPNSAVREFSTDLAFRKDSFGKLQPTASARAHSLTSSPSSLDSSLSSSSSPSSSPSVHQIKPEANKFEPKFEDMGSQLWTTGRESLSTARFGSKQRSPSPPTPPPINSISDPNSSSHSAISSLSSSTLVSVTKPGATTTVAASATTTELSSKSSKLGDSPPRDRSPTSLGPPPLLLLSGGKHHEESKPYSVTANPLRDVKESVTLPPPVLLPVCDLNKEHPKASAPSVTNISTTSAFITSTITTTSETMTTRPSSSLLSAPSMPSNGGLRIKIRLGAGMKVEEPLASSLSPSSSSSTSLSSSGSTPDTPALCGQSSLGFVHGHSESTSETPSDNKIVIRLGAIQHEAMKSESTVSSKERRHPDTSEPTVPPPPSTTVSAPPLQLTISRDRFTYRGQTAAGDSNSSNSSSSSSVTDSPLSSADEDSSVYKTSAPPDLTDSLPPPPCLERLPSRQLTNTKSSQLGTGTNSGSLSIPPPPLTVVSSRSSSLASSGPTSVVPPLLLGNTSDSANVHCKLPPLLPLFSASSSEAIQEILAEPIKPEPHDTSSKENRKRKRRRSSHAKRAPPAKRKLATEALPTPSFVDSKPPPDHPKRDLSEQSRFRIRVDSVFTDDENENDPKEELVRTPSFPTSTISLPPPPPLEKLPVITTTTTTAAVGSLGTKSKIKITNKPPDLFTSPTQPALYLSGPSSADFSPSQTSWTTPNPITSNSFSSSSKVSTAFSSSSYSSSTYVEAPSGKTQPRTKQTSITPTKMSHFVVSPSSQTKSSTNLSIGGETSTLATSNTYATATSTTASSTTVATSGNNSSSNSGISSLGRKDRSRTRIPSEQPFYPSVPVQREPASQIVVASAGSSYYFNNNGEQIWLCPICHLEDDGNLMIGCDSCDDWYHSTCLGLSKEPEVPQWFCPKCSGQPLPTTQSLSRPIAAVPSSSAFAIRTSGSSARKQNDKTPGAHAKSAKRRGKK